MRSVCQFGNTNSQKAWFWSLRILLLLESPMLPCLYGYLLRAVLNAGLHCWKPLISDTLSPLQSFSMSSCSGALCKLELGLWMPIPHRSSRMRDWPCCSDIKSKSRKKESFMCTCLFTSFQMGKYTDHSGSLPTSLRFGINSFAHWSSKYLLSADNVQSSVLGSVGT